MNLTLTITKPFNKFLTWKVISIKIWTQTLGIKKLKALSLSENEQEAHAAWVKCMEICKKYKLRYDDIPCKYD